MEMIFDGKALTDYIKITKVNRGIIPQRENRLYTIPRNSGTVYDSYKYKEKLIPVEFIVIHEDLNAVRRLLAGMLNVSEPVKLIFNDEPNYYWMAIPEGSVDLEETLNLGRGTINFLCPKPWAYRTTEKHFNETDGKINIANEGSAPTSPKFKINFNSDCGFVGLTSPNGAIHLGNKTAVDEVAVPSSETLIDTKFNGDGNTGWVLNEAISTHHNSQSVGNIYEDGHGVRPGNFGAWLSDKEWHGPSLKKAIATDSLGQTTADNWEVYFDFHFRCLSTNIWEAMAMMEIGMLADDSTHMGVVRFGDSLNISDDVGIGIFIGRNVDEYDHEEGIFWDDGGYENFNGSVVINKMGNNFTFEIYNRMTGKSLSKTFYDETIGIKKAKYAYISMTKFKDTTIYDDMSVTYVRFKKHHTQTTKDVPNIFSDGDELIIDNEQGNVTLNGAPYFKTLDISSKFFQILTKNTEINFAYSSWATKPTIGATIRERYY